jgi:hypothetical protein
MARFPTNKNIHIFNFYAVVVIHETKSSQHNFEFYKRNPFMKQLQSLFRHTMYIKIVTSIQISSFVPTNSAKIRHDYNFQFVLYSLEYSSL